jgi:hypothetical protein
LKPKIGNLADDLHIFSVSNFSTFFNMYSGSRPTLDEAYWPMTANWYWMLKTSDSQADDTRDGKMEMLASQLGDTVDHQ